MASLLLMVRRVKKLSESFSSFATFPFSLGTEMFTKDNYQILEQLNRNYGGFEDTRSIDLNTGFSSTRS